MITLNRSIAGLLIVATSAGMSFKVFAASADVEKNETQCKDTINDWLTIEQKRYRAALYGQPEAEDAVIGTVNYINRYAYYKKADNEWYSIEIDDTKLDSDMDAASAISPRRGVFEVKKTLTSELIPHLTKTLMDFQCNVDKVCSQVARSLEEEESVSGSAVFDITDLVGCVDFTGQETFPECHLSKDGELKSVEVAGLVEYCQTIGNELLKREGELLKVATEYDAAYRSMLQFAGDFDLFLSEFKTPITYTVRHAASVIGWMNGLPCFTSSCAEYPIDP